MTEEKFMRIFFEIHTDIPREGPGDAASTKRAFSMLHGLPENPLVLDIGCGPGMQTLALSDLTTGRIVAVDNHQPFLDRLNEAALHKGVSDRTRTVNADMASLDFDRGTFDLIWAEGSAYIMGFETAVCQWRLFLKQSGYLAVTEIAWIKPDPPGEVKRFFAEEYPAMLDIESNLKIILTANYHVVGHFLLPESAWWLHYYAPLEERVKNLRSVHKDDPEALSVIELHEKEIDIYRKYSDWYGYVFYIMQKSR